MQAKPGPQLAALRRRLKDVEQKLEQELRSRGFDPSQIENIPLPSPLASLSSEREQLQSELEELQNQEQPRELQTMNEVGRINDQFTRAFEGGAWHGAAVLELLDGIDATKAAAHPVPNAHSIWELTLHIAAWKNACRRRLEGDRAQLTDEEDWPSISDTGDQAWEATKQDLRQAHHDLLQRISQLDETRLDQPILEDMTSVYGTLHGVIQHDLYHAGQIALLKKAIQGSA